LTVIAAKSSDPIIVLTKPATRSNLLSINFGGSEGYLWNQPKYAVRTQKLTRRLDRIEYTSNLTHRNNRHIHLL
jgi:hypothetical protein